MMQCEHLSVHYPGQTQAVLDDLTVTLHQGETTLLIGPSGSGKTTFLHVLARLLPDTIEAEVTGHHTTDGTVGILFQQPDDQFCMQTVGAEIAFSLENRQIARSEMEDRIRTVLTRVGLDLALTTPIAVLSGGMKQRLALACVLALEPDILLLDEPTAQLDPHGQRMMMELIEELHHDPTLTLVLIEHQLDQCVTFADRVLVFEHGGRLLLDGTPDAIFGEQRDVLIQHGIATPLLYPYTWETLPADSPQTADLRKRDVDRPSVLHETTFDVTGVTARRGNRTIFENLSLTTYRGEWIMVVGPNGAGKSTLLEMLAKLIPLHGGSVQLFETNLRKWKDRAFYAQVGFVFQQPDFQFLKQTVAEELAISCAAFDPERVQTALCHYRLTDVADQSPLALSLGQKRRLSVATMLLEQKAVLLLDEPTFGQDAETTAHIIDVLHQAQEAGTTVIMVTHDMELVHRYADRVLVLGEGRLQFDGTPSALFMKPVLLARHQLVRPLSFLYQQLEEVKHRAGKQVIAHTY
ncbi:ATP-binding cassette domain-containing protein [Exiguobacterium antarcticum]|uniref:ATP-binding cassette domain-containing protein n=1 Tax=Exiguobacterium antarcticum TaxID=132920 RepID=A0ABT6R5Z6_9BACL|nr:ATP-binding cassette domain-containing protein [Exiguobacterium antarcticum]MDI3236223.1 ATP-binding cassette domain-containing protein [Exiguobacterium antarcticum]